MKKVKAFTLAEVLITLGIIGVVASLTIPILVNSYQKTQYVTGLKKVYTEWNQALMQLAADKGCVGDLICTGVFDENTTNESMGNELVKYFKVVKNCESTDEGGPEVYGCFSNNTAMNYDGSGGRSSFFDASGGNYNFITSDGMTFNVENWEYNCQMSDTSMHLTYNMTQVCAEMYVDVNGFKGPNNFGRDIFHFYITNGKGPLLYPSGGVDDNNYNPWQTNGTPTSCYPGNTDGNLCAGRVMEQGWQMNY